MGGCNLRRPVRWLCLASLLGTLLLGACAGEPQKPSPTPRVPSLLEDGAPEPEKPKDDKWQRAEALVQQAAYATYDDDKTDRYKAAIKICPYYYLAYYGLCQLLRTNKQPEEAIKYWQQFLQPENSAQFRGVEPHNYESATGSARSQIYEMRLSLAEEHARASIQVEGGPWSPAAAEWMARAIEQAELAAQVGPLHPLAHKLRGVYCFQRAGINARLEDADAYHKDLASAKAALLEAVKNGGDAETLFYLGWVEMSLGNVEEAHKQWKAYLARAPRPPKTDAERFEVDMASSMVDRLEEGFRQTREMLSSEVQGLRTLLKQVNELEAQLIQRDKDLKRTGEDVAWLKDKAFTVATVYSYASALRLSWAQSSWLLNKMPHLDTLSKRIGRTALMTSLGGAKVSKEFIMDAVFQPVESTVTATEYWFNLGSIRVQRTRWEIDELRHKLELLRLTLSNLLGQREQKIRSLEILLNWRSTLDPSYASTWEERLVVGQLFEPLLRYDASNQLQPAAARSWHVSPDNRTFTFDIDPDAFWSDGTPVRAEDFAYGLVRHKASGSEWASLLEAVEEIRAVDELTLEIVSRQPAPDLPHALALHVGTPLPRWAIDAHGADWTRAENIVANGPFTLLEQTDGDLLLVPNAYYRRAHGVGLEALLVTLVAEREALLPTFLQGQGDLVPLDDTSQLASFGLSSQTVSVPPAHTCYLAFNAAAPPTHDPWLRRALASALDRRSLAQAAGGGARMPASRLLPPALPLAAGESVGYGYDLDAAHRLLQEAGFDPSSQPLVLLGFAGQEPLLQAIAQQWHDALGLTVELRVVEQGSFFETLAACAQSGECGYHAYVNSQQLQVADPAGLLASWATGAAAAAFSGWADASYDAALEAARQASDASRRDSLLLRAEEILADQAIVVPLYHRSHTTLLAQPGVSGPWPSFGVPDLGNWQDVR